MKLRHVLALCLACIPFLWVSSAAAPQGKDLATLKAELLKSRDDADPKLIAELAGLHTREALDCLIELYKTCFVSLYMRLEVIQALGKFDDLDAAASTAAVELTNIATADRDVELRDMAIDTLANCPKEGKEQLKAIVQSIADAEVRERAMEKVVAKAEASDRAFFESVYNALDEELKGKDQDKDKDKGKKGSKKDAVPEKKPHSLKSLREAAFRQIVQDEKIFDADKLKLLTKERDDTGQTTDWERKAGVRRLALLELERRKHASLLGAAQEMYKSAVERGVNRAEAARILADLEGAKMLPLFIEDGAKDTGTVDEVLRMTMGDLVAKMRDDDAAKVLVKMIGKGDEPKARFALRALHGYREPAFIKAMIKHVLADAKRKVVVPKDAAAIMKLESKSDAERNLTLQMLANIGACGDKGVLDDLRKVLDANQDSVVLGATLDAIGELQAQSSEWLASLDAYAKDARVELRNAALMTLGKSKDPKFLGVLTAALEHADWSTRLAALEGLGALRSREAVAAIIGRMDKEVGWNLHSFANVLWKLTGKSFRTSATGWKSWWEKEGADFKPISLSELTKLEADEEVRRLKLTTGATFFGVRIISQRVMFIIDVSGSMNWEVNSEKDGKEGESRIAIAKNELVKCLESLDSQSWFNILTFSSSITTWLDSLASEFNGKQKDGLATLRKAAIDHVKALTAGGATHLYSALEHAFRDPDVDTIILLSDGEPSADVETDQYVIRERVQQWNEHRGIVIHTIAVGGNFQILEWLAQDSGGTHRKFQ